VQILEENQLDFIKIEYLKNPPTKEELINIGKALKLKPREYIRKGEKIYKELNIERDLLDSDKLFNLISKHPILLERPIVIKNNRGVIGRPPEKILSLL
tara:strand:- start:1245 stop:1541 length:297 start_codon:yes stop_codon:yes gene_type:complete